MTHDASHSYSYDAENRITAVDGGGTATYGYDVDGRRVSRVVAGVETDYLYDLSGRVVADYGGGCGATCWRVGYIYLNGQMVADYFGGTYFVHGDHLGSTRLLTGYPTPSVAECDDYYPFGEQVSCGGTSTTTHKFTGYERDAESGLDNAQARYYGSPLGRFMSPDPIGNFVADATNPQTWNMYAYVNNNPLMMTDPSGMGGTGPQDCPGGDGGNDCGGLTSSSFTPPPIFSQSNPPTCWGSSCPVWDPLQPIGPPQPPPTSGGGGGGGTCYYVLVNPCGGPQPSQSLNNCTSSQFAVGTISFTASQAHGTGTFTGAKAGIYTGPTTPDLPGPYRFTVTNNVFMTLSAVTSSFLMQGGTVGSGQMVGGLTFKSDPFTNFNAYNQSPTQIVDSQIFELGNSLAYITHTMPANPNTEPGPNNTEPGRRLLVCYQSGSPQ